MRGGTRGVAALDDRLFTRAVKRLRRVDRGLDAIVRRHGVPPMNLREPGFAALVRYILEQQVSLASAHAVFQRLTHTVKPLTARRLVVADDALLRGVGFTRQKTAYTKGLAGAVASGRLDLSALENMPDDEVRERLMSLKGIGRWTADVYLLLSLGRPDIWPDGDLALAEAVRKVRRLRSRPTPERLVRIAEQWRPYRAVAARLLWHEYLGGKAPAFLD